MEDKARAYFEKTLSDRERAIFELGIALAFAYHQFLGMPFKARDRINIEKAIEAAILSQPFRVHARVELKVEKMGDDPYSYNEISPRNLMVEVKVKYGSCLVTGELKWVENLNYPLMYVKEIEIIQE